jgi:alkane 1-monooxygenase
MVRFWPFCLGYVYAVAVVLGLSLHGAFEWAPVLLTFAILPVLDVVAGVNPLNPAPKGEDALLRDPRFRLLTWSWLAVGFGLTIAALHAACRPDAGWQERAVLAAGTGLMNGAIGITYAHELIHRPGRFEQLLGEALLALVTYSHFRIEHIAGHHLRVATREDPATARRGESFYHFLIRSITGGVRSAWGLECARLARRGLPPWSARNRMLWYGVVTALTYAAVARAFGVPGVAFFALQSAVAVASLEAINYIEHYGLERKQVGTGRYETTKPSHSWNASQRLSNYILINLARHSDHHTVAYRRYPVLRTFDSGEAPQLPQGYAAMYLLALVPPLWFRVMNPRADRWRTAERAG